MWRAACRTCTGQRIAHLDIKSGNVLLTRQVCCFLFVAVTISSMPAMVYQSEQACLSDLFSPWIARQAWLGSCSGALPADTSMGHLWEGVGRSSGCI